MNLYNQVSNEDFSMKIFGISSIDSKLLFVLFTVSFSYLIVLVQTDLAS